MTFPPIDLHAQPDGLKPALKTWCEREKVSTTMFAGKMAYTYGHAWNLINGKAPITVEVVGRFALAFGAQAAGDWISLAATEADEIAARSPITPQES